MKTEIIDLLVVGFLQPINQKINLRLTTLLLLHLIGITEVFGRFFNHIRLQ